MAVWLSYTKMCSTILSCKHNVYLASLISYNVSLVSISEAAFLIICHLFTRVLNRKSLLIVNTYNQYGYFDIDLLTACQNTKASQF
jgi:hypothetical protein